jgi:hypothetical protein
MFVFASAQTVMLLVSMLVVIKRLPASAVTPVLP